MRIKYVFACLHILTVSDVMMSLFEIRYNYDTIITKNRDYRCDFDFSSNATTISTGPLCSSTIRRSRRGRGGGLAGGLDGGGQMR